VPHKVHRCVLFYSAENRAGISVGLDASGASERHCIQTPSVVVRRLP